MSTVVYLSNQQVQVINGTMGKKSVSVKDVITEEAPEGSIINGMVMDIEMFTTFLKDLWERRKLPDKDVYLVIGSTKFLGKSITMPAMKEKKAVEYIEREFKDMGRDEEMVYAYISLPSTEKKMQKIYAEGIDPEFIKDYVDMFAEIGVKLKAIYSSEGTQINLISQTLARKNKTFVYLGADKITLTTILFVEGQFYYYNTARCFHDQGTFEYAEDVGRTLSQLSQFMQANQIEAKLENIFLAGMDPRDLDQYMDAIEAHGINTPVEMFSQSFMNTIQDMQSYIIAASGLFQNGKWQNFLQHYQLKKAKNGAKENASARKTIIMIGASFAVMIAILIATIAARETKRAEYRNIYDYNHSPMIMGDVKRYDVYSERNRFLMGQFHSLDDLQANLDTYPVGTQSVLDEIQKCAVGYAEIEFEAFHSDAGSIVFVANSSEVENINKFIKNLMENNVFTSVDYTGYNRNEATNTWDIHVTCILREKTGQEGGNEE